MVTACPERIRLLKLEHVTFGYEKDRTILNDVSLYHPAGQLLSRWWGSPAAAKSTIAALLSGSRTGYTGSVTLGGCRCRSCSRNSACAPLTLVPHNAAIFKGTVEATCAWQSRMLPRPSALGGTGTGESGRLLPQPERPADRPA